MTTGFKIVLSLSGDYKNLNVGLNIGTLKILGHRPWKNNSSIYQESQNTENISTLVNRMQRDKAKFFGSYLHQ